MDTHDDRSNVLLKDVLANAQQTLYHHDIEYAEHDALELCAAAADCSISDLRRFLLLGYTCRDSFGLQAQDTLHRFNEMIVRRSAREPLQYIVQSTVFRYITVSVGPGVFIPRPETELIVERGLQWLQQEKQDIPCCVVDFCSGSGVIGLSLAVERSQTQVYGVEKNDTAYTWLQKNSHYVASSYASGSTFTPIHADALSATTLQELNGVVDCVITNPPYLPLARPVTQPEAQYDPEDALYGGSQDGLSIPQGIVDQAHRLLKPGGFLIMEHDITQGESLQQYFKQSGFSDVRTCCDLTHRPRWTEGIKVQ